MEQLATDLEIYKFWASHSKDHRYLRPKRWAVLKKFAIANNVRTVLEFGSGISTLLFSNMGIKVTSVETDKNFMEFVENLCPFKAEFILSSNKRMFFSHTFDMALVDGTLPRAPQLETALHYAPLIAIDDFGGSLENRLTPLLSGCERLDDKSTLMSVFRVKFNLN